MIDRLSNYHWFLKFWSIIYQKNFEPCKWGINFWADHSSSDDITIYVALTLVWEEIY